jgi:hypothetical protein
MAMGVAGVSAARVAGMNPGRAATEYRAMKPVQRNELMSRMDPQKRAETMSRMNNSQRAEAMFKMSPEQRAQTLARMSPGMRNSLLAPQARMNERGERGEQLSSRLGSPLRFRGDAREMPRAGDVRTGRAGALDPGRFLRQAPGPSAVVNPAFARAQFAQHMPNFAAIAAHNQANLMARSNWSWQVPPYAPGWFSGSPGPWNWNNNWWQPNNYGWLNGPGFWNGYYGSLPWWMRLMSLWPGGINSNLGWLPYTNCYSAYYWDGNNYPIDYYATNGYVPTQYVFSVPNGRFWHVGSGYSNYLPSGYNAPITVAVKESVPQYNTFGQIVGYKFETFYYNAFWDNQARAYGYYDYRQQYHLANLPGLNTYSSASQYAEPQYGPTQYAVPQQYAPQQQYAVPQQYAPQQYAPAQYPAPQQY